MSRMPLVFTLIVLAGCASAAPPAVAPVHDADGFEVLFDGIRADGWKQAGPGGFTIKDGEARSHGGMGLWYYERKKFKDYILRLEFKRLGEKTNSGVFIRFPRVDNDPWIPVEEGYEIQIAGDKPGTHATGSVYSFQSATEAPIKPVGEWNQYEIRNQGATITVTLNGKEVNSYKGDRSLKGGMIGVQNHDDASIIAFRNIRLKELPAKAGGK